MNRRAVASPLFPESQLRLVEQAELSAAAGWRYASTHPSKSIDALYIITVLSGCCLDRERLQRAYFSDGRDWPDPTAGFAKSSVLS